MRKKFIIIYIVIIAGLLPRPIFMAEIEAGGLGGRILLQVEENGEAWYVEPETLERYYLGRPQDAFRVMREQGVGITNADLEKIPVGLAALTGLDSDGDGLPDAMELAIGTNRLEADTDGDGFNDREELDNFYNPLGPGNGEVDWNFITKNRGKIFLQIESHGEAWYVNPADNKRYFLGRPADAYSIMRTFGLGATNADINKLVTSTPIIDISEFEELIFDFVNRERSAKGLHDLKWNSEVAAVAREHSNDLALENASFTGFAMSCDFPIIHHEGRDFGISNGERLNNRGVHYFSQTGENIALLSAVKLKIRTSSAEYFDNLMAMCQTKRDELDQSFSARLASAGNDSAKIEVLNDEAKRRGVLFSTEKRMNVSQADWFTPVEVAKQMVEGWMESQGHRKNILTGEYDETGIGLVQSNGYVFATQVFIKRAECGFETGACCEKTGYYPYCFEPLECGKRSMFFTNNDFRVGQP